MRGVLSYGSYLPYHRLKRKSIGQALGVEAGKGARSVAGYDEDTTSLAVEAGRLAMRGMPTNLPRALLFATTTPAYLDKNNASAIHAALQLQRDVCALDCGTALRSGATALRLAATSGEPVLAISADIRSGLPGSPDELAGGDAAAAFLFGDDSDGPVLAHVLAHASVTLEVMDRWRLPGAVSSHTWEERFAEQVYLSAAEQALADALRAAELSSELVDIFIVAGVHQRAVRAVKGVIGATATFAPDLVDVVGNPGAAQLGMQLAATLDQSTPGQTIIAINLADGVDVLVFRTTDAIRARGDRVSLAELIERTDDSLAYTDFLTWRGLLDRERPRRPEPQRPAPPAAARATAWKFGFVGSRDRASGTVHLPPQRVSFVGDGIDDMEAAPMAEVCGRVATFTIDHLAYSLSPPTVVVVVDFDGGGRFRCEMTDVSPAHVTIGMPVEMSFRRLYTSEGMHNYFWKARPARMRRAEGDEA